MKESGVKRAGRCDFNLWAAWNIFFSQYRFPVYHRHDKFGAIEVTQEKLSKPRRSKSHVVKVLRRAIARRGGMMNWPSSL